ncbi:MULTISPECIES: acetyl-CoA carboxylase biotin carboxyl carrier protein subunit [unclassified Comamonas]|uniref:acetyl-CoA carboxylase biotin carboxyl carrier protein subunit n=1 Tax=unclassified Comamonas TaxID=2638500 RepID=UPI001FA7AFC8|nr:MULTISPECIES: acetyl-CoA carboxylase biotin carboxyl carrier protein subunit [unclassified Comamonas]UNV88544.1 acetyl-CoA carboxylase biotin carboxyl carrier protein subunit [Comamonas sp. 7D-2evo1]UNV93553.1 acetyl-CoA carboxylase biotin carboxyl carrier protein subunit [Comamonas sp. 7D-2]UNV98187.1 acetyl-CoA carboxylase biotin carboxyl carrier protein subunit [Comamonas sp. 7D-2evo2]
MNSKRIEVKSDVTGSVWKIETTVGALVEEGDSILVVESMKMEIHLAAPQSGRVVELLIAEGAPVADEQVIAILEVPA